MKIKSLLIGMLACTALVGCSDDDVLNNAEQENQQAEKMRAYMTFSIASSTNSSRGVGEGTTNGDNHGNAEHSGHETAGTTEEQKVNSILICFYNTKEGSTDGFSHLFTMSDNQSDSYEYMSGYSTQLVPEGDGYMFNNPIAINSLGTYNVMVVVNPATSLGTNLNAKTKDDAIIIYNKIKDEFSTSVEDIIGSGKNNFMMANRKPAQIEVKAEHNDPANAAGKDAEAIEVERVVSKITFRPKKLTDTKMPAKLGTEDNDGTNVYKIEETEYKYTIDQDDFWFKDADGVYRYLTNLFKAEDPDGNVYWVHIDKDETTGVISKELYKQITCPQEDDIKGGDADDDQYSGSLSTGNSVKAFVVNRVSVQPDTYVYVGSKSQTGNKIPYYVKLTGYTLVNLNNKVYYVRHTSTDMETGSSWGFVNSNNKYIFEPNSKDKSAVTFTSNPLAWGTGSASTYYNNDFATVVQGIANGTYKMNPFGTTGASDVKDYVTPTDPEGLKAETPEDNTTGYLLGYCLENAVLASKQNALTSTSIIFEAQIYDKDGEALNYMIEWNGSFYKNFLALQQATATDENDITTSIFWEFADEDYPTTEEGREQWAEKLANEGATLYHDGKCYYFSSQIKHFADTNEDDKEGGKGVMEFAIMRNNVYSLSVESVEKFGFSSINLESGVLDGDESGTEQEKLYLTMKAKILPWIVRFNNIEF